jgi:TatD DNase family protein
MIDTHCHIAGEEFAADLGDVVARAQAAGLERAICILAADDPAELDRARVVQEAWPAVTFATGIHPHAAGKYAHNVSGAADFTRAGVASIPDVVAVGEIGLDYHYDFAPRDVQAEVFAGQVALAVELDRPVVIHTRDAMADTVALLKDAGQGRVRGVIHCFTGTADEARLALALDFYVSFAGILTFPRAQSLREAARLVPLDRVLVETDAPYLAPVPYRGKRNEPAWVTETLRALADAKQISVESAAAAVSANAARLFCHPAKT